MKKDIFEVIEKIKRNHRNDYINKSLGGNNMKDVRFEEFKNKVIKHLEKLENREKKEIKKSLLNFESTSLEKAGYPVGTIREWKGKKYIKVAPNKWKPKYDDNSRGAKMAIAALKRKASQCTSSQELMQLVLENKVRFADEDGRPLPFVKELSEYVSELNDNLESAKTSKKETPEEDGGGGDDGNEQSLGHAKRLRIELKENLKSQIGLHKNKKTGIEAELSGNSINKISSEKAIEKSKVNGFSIEQHFEVANKIVELYENATLIKTSADKKGSENILSIKRFDSNVILKNGTKATAHITVKESVQNGHKIYSVEVMELKKNTTDKTSVVGGGAVKQTQASISSVPQSEKKSTFDFSKTPVANVVKKYADDKKIKKASQKIDIDDFCDKDNKRPFFAGVYHDSGYQVATDGKILACIKSDYDKENEGKCLQTDKSGGVIDLSSKYTYPDYKRIILKKGIDISKDFSDKTKLLKLCQIAKKYKKISKNKNIRLKVGDNYFDPDYLFQLLSMSEKHRLNKFIFDGSFLIRCEGDKGAICLTTMAEPDDYDVVFNDDGTTKAVDETFLTGTIEKSLEYQNKKIILVFNKSSIRKYL